MIISTAVDSKIAGLVCAAHEDQRAKDLRLDLNLLTMLAHLIEKSRPRIEGEIAMDLGFGMSLVRRLPFQISGKIGVEG